MVPGNGSEMTGRREARAGALEARWSPEESSLGRIWLPAMSLLTPRLDWILGCRRLGVAVLLMQGQRRCVLPPPALHRCPPLEVLHGRRLRIPWADGVPGACSQLGSTFLCQAKPASTRKWGCLYVYNTRICIHIYSDKGINSFFREVQLSSEPAPAHGAREPSPATSDRSDRSDRSGAAILLLGALRRSTS